jgi:hypothetical protein
MENLWIRRSNLARRNHEMQRLLKRWALDVTKRVGKQDRILVARTISGETLAIAIATEGR